MHGKRQSNSQNGNKTIFHWIHKFVVWLTYDIHENWFTVNKTCYTVEVKWELNYNVMSLL